MREKKVRAWDKVTEIYLYSDRFPSMWQFYKELENRGIRHFETEDYTGRKDKNGKEIYEGDVVSYKAGSLNIKALVGWCDFNLCFALNPDAEDKGIPEQYHTMHPPFTNCYEIIGNIYENPELLEK
jgi:uncharacterized phage protein (TIGR01671 family)